MEEQGKCQVLYADESGFCLQPCLPYLWQEKGQTVRLPAQAHSRRFNVLGFLRHDSQVWSFPTQQTVTTEYFITSVEELMPQLDRPTVVVLDNASVHRSRAVQQKRREWKRRGLRLLYMPAYGPHLNDAESLWLHIKYHWLGPAAYQNFPALCQSVTDILQNMGTKYRISFA